MYRHRTIERCLKQAMKRYPVLLITGPRQVGKTTVFQHISQETHAYVTLDDPSLRELASSEPALFLERFPPPILIDEIQYAPSLLPYIKMHVDKHQKSGDFLLTGSQQFHVMKGVTESLAGRVASMHLLGLSLREIDDEAETVVPFLPTTEQLKEREKTASSFTLDTLYRLIWRGSFPAMAIGNREDQGLYYSSYVQTYLHRDVRDILQVGDLTQFHRFLRAAAARTASLLNLSDLARDCGVSPVTARKWLSILEASGIVYLLEPFHVNVTKRLVKAPKLYFLDTGLAAHLTEWSSPQTLEAGAMSGAILETFVVAEILKSYWHNGLHAPLYYYRDRDLREVDLLIAKDNQLFPVEIKKSATPVKESIAHFRPLERLGVTVGRGAVICLCHQRLPISKEVDAVPVGFL